MSLITRFGRHSSIIFQNPSLIKEASLMSLLLIFLRQLELLVALRAKAGVKQAQGVE
jgi:hypothetical protein